MTRFISTPSRTKEILEQYGLRAKKGFGQNFLVDPVIVERCAEEAHCDGAVIEIGPGIGSLTEQLARHAKHVVSYEVDPDLPAVLKETLKEYDNVEIILQDFLTVDLTSVVKELKEKYGMVTVCSNLPYYITTPILFRIFEEGKEIPYITVMVQKEVGERFAAKPGNKEYGAISAEAQYLYDVKKLFNVPGRSFNPSPDVDSVIIQFRRKEDADLNLDLNAYFELVRAAFKQRRKTIYNNLRDYFGSADKANQALEQAGVSPKARAQELSASDLKKIYEASL
jgi:16S rRNA (adenine1518-N6/adenine1519-N6)-dimethyltransferase